MRIKEYGHIKPREVKCNGCGAVLEYTNPDLFYSIGRRKFALCCPICDMIIETDNDGELLRKAGESHD